MDSFTLANIEVALVEEGGKHYVYLANDGSSGEKHEYHSDAELASFVALYVVEVRKDNIEACREALGE